MMQRVEIAVMIWLDPRTIIINISSSSTSKPPSSRVVYASKTKALDKPSSLPSPCANNILTSDTVVQDWFKQMELVLNKNLSATPSTRYRDL